MKPQKEERKIRVLAWGDYCCTTGFATVMSNIMRTLDTSGKYELTIVGINYTGDPYDQTKFPGSVWPAKPGTISMGTVYDDVYGRQRVLDLAGSGEFDVLFLLQDTFILETIMEPLKKTQEALAAGGFPFKIVYYFPLDATPKKEWIDNVVTKVDFPVTYTNYAANEIKKFYPELDIPVAYHGTNTDDFFPVDDKKAIAEFRNAYFGGKADDRYLIMNVNRNQPRKDIVRSLMILAELKKRGRNPLLYLHMQHMDAGGNIFVMADQLGLVNEEDFVLPHPKIFNSNTGIPVERLNLLYNAADAVLTTTLGEGWGLSITEAMATNTPIIAPDNTSLTEMLAENRGVLVPSGDNPSAFVMKDNDLERIRPTMNVELAADAIERLMDGKAAPDLDLAYVWAASQTWKKITEKQWMPLIDQAADIALHPENHMSRPQRRLWERKQAVLAKKAASK